MPGSEEKARRKALRDASRAEERDAIRSSLPLLPAEMKALFDYLDERLGDDECDDTLRFTSEFLGSSKHDAGPVLKWLENAGGYCDCEVLNNAEEKFRFAFPDE